MAISNVSTRTFSVYKFNRLSLEPFLALADMHPHALTFSQRR